MRFRGTKNCLLFIAACTVSLGSTLVVPTDQASAAGNAAPPLGAVANRFQEIVGGGQFPGPMLITGIRYRSAPGSGPVSVSYASYKITLSSQWPYSA
jgi:hypothetical protein